MTDSTCPLCGHPTEFVEAVFEMRVFVMKAGPNEGKVALYVVPDGLSILTCNTNDGCGEEFHDWATALPIDEAGLLAETKYPELLPLLEKIRQDTRERYLAAPIAAVRKVEL